MTGSVSSAESARMRHAYQEIRTVSAQLQNPKDAKTYVNTIAAFPALVRNSGLIQALTFLIEKVRTDRCSLFDALHRWVCSSLTTEVLVSTDNTENVAEREARMEFVYAIAGLGPREYMIITREVLAYSDWLKRLTRGRWDKDGKDLFAEDRTD